MDYNPEELRGLFKYVDKEVKPYWIQNAIGMSDRFSFLNDCLSLTTLSKGLFAKEYPKSFELPIEFLEVV